MINLNSTAPPAPTGGQNVTWQQDGSGNVSAYISTVSNLVNKVLVAPSGGILTIDASTGNSFRVNVNANITSSTISNATIDGQEITILWVQDGTGHTIVLPTNLLGATAPSTTPNKRSAQKFTYDSTTTNWYAVAAGSTNM